MVATPSEPGPGERLGRKIGKSIGVAITVVAAIIVGWLVIWALVALAGSAVLVGLERAHIIAEAIP